jgi:phage terminase small subunit
MAKKRVSKTTKAKKVKRIARAKKPGRPVRKHLPDMQEKFLRLLIDNQAKTGADRQPIGRLYEQAGYATRGLLANKAASRLTRIPGKFRDFYRAALARLQEKVEVSTADVLTEEKRLAFQDIIGIFEPNTDTLIKPSQLPEDIRRAIASIKVIELPTGSTVYQYKFWNKGQALERLSRHLGMYEKDQEQGRATILINSTDISKPSNAGTGKD